MSVTRQPVVTEEVAVGKRKVQETHRVDESVRKEELDVDSKGGARVHGKGGRSSS